MLSYNRRAKICEAEKDLSSLVTVEEHHDPLIDYKLFKLCNHILSLQTNHSKMRTRKQTHCHILSGLLFCAKCEQPLLSQEGSTQKSGWKYSSYVCRGRRKKYCDNPYTSDLHLLPPLVLIFTQHFACSDQISRALELGRIGKAVVTSSIDSYVEANKEIFGRSLRLFRKRFLQWSRSLPLRK